MDVCPAGTESLGGVCCSGGCDIISLSITLAQVFHFQRTVLSLSPGAPCPQGLDLLLDSDLICLSQYHEAVEHCPITNK